MVETLLAGARKAEHVSIPHQIVDQIRQDVTTEGRLQPVGSIEGNYYAAAFQGRFAYKAGLALLCLACALALIAFLRMYRVGTSTLLIVAVAFALSLQFREVHDPALGYYAGSQFMMLTFFGAWSRICASSAVGRAGGMWPHCCWSSCCSRATRRTIHSSSPSRPFISGRDPARRRSWRYSWPILGLGAAVTLLAAYLHSRATLPPGVAGYATSLNVIGFVQTELRETVSGIPNIYFLSGAQGLLDQPTKAEILGASWRAGLAALLALMAFLIARREPTRHPVSDAAVPQSDDQPFGALQIGLVGVVLMVGSGLFIALAKQWQEYIQLGTGHLATFANTLGFVLVAVAVWIQWRRSLAAYTSVIVVAVVVVFGMALAGQYSNLRVAAVEQPGIQQRELFQAGLERGVLDDVKDGATVEVTARDMNWSALGTLLYPGALDYFTYLNTGRKFDVQNYGAPAVPLWYAAGIP